MTRGLTAPVEAAVDAEHVPYLIFVELDWPSGIVRMCNAFNTFPWNGHDWIAMGNLGHIDVIREGAELQMVGLEMSLSGVNPSLVAAALQENYQGRAARVWFAPLDPDTYVPLADPVGPFQYRMDSSGLVSGKNPSVTLTAESPFADYDRPRIRRWTDEDQQAVHPGDTFFSRVPSMQELEILF
jgi:hypothetical protein